MELEELKNARQAIKAPQESPGKTMNASDNAVDGLIAMLKTEDAKQLAALKRSRPLWWIAAACWAVVLVVVLVARVESSRPEDAAFPLKGLLALVFVGLAVGTYVHIKKLAAIDYTEPVTLFLRNAAKRYQFMSTPYLVLSILVTSVLALAASSVIVDVFDRYLGIHDDTAGSIAAFAFAALVYLFGYVVSKKAWMKTKGPMLNEIRRMQDELQG
jgi:hypothetical protein